MSNPTATKAVDDAYAQDALVIADLGPYGDGTCFGLILQDAQKTVDLPTYLLVSPDGDITRVEMPVYADGAYAKSDFAAMEEAFRFFEDHGLLFLEPETEDEEALTPQES